MLSEQKGVAVRATRLIKTFLGRLRGVLPSRPKITHSFLIKGTLLSLVIILALGIRLLPLRWGFYLNEFDPYFHYYTARYISDNGFSAFFSWHDWRGWWPYGRYMPSYSNLGLTLTAVTLSRILTFLGLPLTLSPNPLDPLTSDPLYNLCVIFPLITSALTCIIMYLLGRELGGETVGLLSALLLALNPAYVSRTALGWFDDETIGILSTLLFLLFFSRATDGGRTTKSSIVYSILAGLSLGYLCISWGAARYLMGVIAIYAFILLVIRRYSPRLLTSYVLVLAISLLIATSSPRLGLGFLLETFNLPSYGMLILLLAAELYRLGGSMRKKIVYTSALMLVSMAAFAALFSMGFIRDPAGKFLYTLFPTMRSESPLFESVAEHRSSSWETFYSDFEAGLLFVPVGIFFASLMATNLSILTVVYCITSIYFASSLVRLMILASPIICLLWSLAIRKTLIPLILSLREGRPLGRKAKLRPFEKELVGGILVLLFAIFSLTYVFGVPSTQGLAPTIPRAIYYADVPATISGASLNIKPSSTVRDWINALIWMRDNLPPSPSRPGEGGAVIASWWDYGYWITIFGNKTTLADNGTFNSTQIQQIGRMFMSSEEEAIRILRQYNATHVVVYVTFSIEHARYGVEYALYYGAQYGGDNGKWIWMARIAGLNDRDFGNLTIGWDWTGGYGLRPNARGQNTTLYKLMAYGIEMTVNGRSTIELKHFRKAYFSRDGPITSLPETFNIVPLVCIYEVVYE